MTIKRAYILGPKLGDTFEEATQQVMVMLTVAGRALNRGYLPVVPQLEDLVDDHRDTEDHHKHVLRSLKRDRDIVMLCPGWELDKHATAEVMLCEFLNLKLVSAEEVDATHP